MIYLVIFAFVLCFVVFPFFRCCVLNIVSVVVNGVVDLVEYVKKRKYNNVEVGKIIAYVGLFGKGKTLSVVHKVCKIYREKNGKMVYCPRRKKFVRQVIRVVSNVDLSIPYEKFVSLSQIVYTAEEMRGIDDKNDTLTVTLVLGDEFSVQMNSRQFKTNIDPLLLNTILTCRHHYISLYYTAQRFQHVDALLRQVTSYVVDCNKVWRLQGQRTYDAWDIENATSSSMVRPLHKSCWFVRNRDYSAYDTLACVDNLKKSCKDGDMMTEQEIIALRTVGNVNDNTVCSPSRKKKKIDRAMAG